MGDLNAVVVPTYLTRSAKSCLLRLSDVCGRRDMAPTVAEARRLARSLDMLEKAQEPPRGDHLIAKAVLTRIPQGHWRESERTAAFRSLFEAHLLPVFKAHDEARQGKIRVHLLLTTTG